MAGIHTRRFWRAGAAAALLLGLPIASEGISPDNLPSEDNSVEGELALFQVHPEFEVELYADESLGIANPIALQWDWRGRLWVLCTQAYAQLKPDELPDDKLMILEDRDGDGRADHSIEFAGGLNMPTGFALGHGGVYLAQGPELLFLRDLDGDDQADGQELLLTGFGTGDTHQNISSLVFDAGGFLYFSQGLHTFSQVETPWGVSRGDTAGFWRFDPRTSRLDPYCFPSMASQNPWGIALDRWGALFVKSNGPHLCFATPGLIPTTHPRELMVYAQVGQTPGKSMGVEIVESQHLPPWVQNHAIIAGYFAREVSALPLVPDGSGFAKSLPVRLLYGGHASFRPVDIRQGPDGGIYVADWFNPIINHYQVSLRHPDRDYSHGRIWRLQAKDAPRVEPPSLNSEALIEVFSHLASGEKWTREQARRVLSDRSDFASVTEELIAWMSALDSGNRDQALGLVEGAGVLESHGSIHPRVLDLLMTTENPYPRAAAARILGRASHPVPDADSRLARLLGDEHPRVRLEAVLACANRPGSSSLLLALRALDSEVDRFLAYSLKQSVHALKPDWLTREGSKGGADMPPEHLAFVLETYGGEHAARLARDALRGELSGEARLRLLHVLAQVGNSKDLEQVFRYASDNRNVDLLASLVQTNVIPPKAIGSELAGLIESGGDAVRTVALQLAGHWRVSALAPSVEQVALNPAARGGDRAMAARSLASLRGRSAVASLSRLAESPDVPSAVRRAAFEGMVRVDLPAAAGFAAARLTRESVDKEDPSLVLDPLLNRGGGAEALTEAFRQGVLPGGDMAREILTRLNRRGRSDAGLTDLLREAGGIEVGDTRYDPARVAALVEAIRAGGGDPEKGREIYERPQLGCVACHRIGDAGGVIGPPLTALADGLPLDQIVESILWPERQIKEGYQALVLTRKDGRVITGYLEREGDDILWYRNTTTPWILPLSREEIAKRESIPTLMPPGLTQSLSEEEFLDLIAYLAALRG